MAAEVMTPVPFTRLLRAEWRKSTDTRAVRWLLAATMLVTAAALAVPLAFPHHIAQDRASYLFWAGIGVTRLLPVVTLLAMTAEWSQRGALTTFTFEPRRNRVTAAKVASGLILSMLAAALAFGAAELVLTAARAWGPARAAGTAWNWPQLAGFAAFVVLVCLTGTALGAAIGHTAAAVVTYFALGAAFNLLLIPALQRAGYWLNTGQTFGWMLTGDWSGHGAQIATSAALWILVPLAIGLIRVSRRDVS